MTTDDSRVCKQLELICRRNYCVDISLGGKYVRQKLIRICDVFVWCGKFMHEILIIW